MRSWIPPSWLVTRGWLKVLLLLLGAAALLAAAVLLRLDKARTILRPALGPNAADRTSLGLGEKSNQVSPVLPENPAVRVQLLKNQPLICVRLAITW